jgi:hypothetical protein
MTSPPGSAGIPFGRERSDLEAPRAGEERATAPHRVGGAGPQPRPRSRDPSTYPRATQPPLARRNPFAPANARSRAAGRSVGPEPRETDQREVAAGHWQGPFRSHRRAEATAGWHRQGFAARLAEPMDGARPQRSRSERSERGRSGQRPGFGHPDEQGRAHDSYAGGRCAAGGLERGTGWRANLHPVHLTPYRPPCSSQLESRLTER